MLLDKESLIELGVEEITNGRSGYVDFCIWLKDEQKVSMATAKKITAEVLTKINQNKAEKSLTKYTIQDMTTTLGIIAALKNLKYNNDPDSQLFIDFCVKNKPFTKELIDCIDALGLDKTNEIAISAVKDWNL